MAAFRVWLFVFLISSAFSEGQTLLENGLDLYLTSGGYGCAVCHGPVADGAGQAGGAIRGAKLNDIEESLKTVAPMMPLRSVLSEQDRIALAAYLESLVDVSLVSLTFDGKDWRATMDALPLNNAVDITLFNNSFEATSIDLSIVNLGTVELAALERKAFRLNTNALLEKLKPLNLTLEPL